MEKVILLLVNLSALYLGLGALFALIFLARWIYTLDESAQGSPFTFRLMILPGCVLLWPVLLRKYLMKIRKS